MIMMTDAAVASTATTLVQKIDIQAMHIASLLDAQSEAVMSKNAAAVYSAS